MASKLVDLGQQLEIICEPGCWVSDKSASKLIIQGNLSSIERTLESALDTLKEGKSSLDPKRQLRLV